MTSAYTVKDLSFSYHKTPVLKVDDFFIDKGSVSALVGPNGAGKSTLLNILTFVTAANQGDIRFFEEPVNSKRRNALRRRVGYVQQNPYLFNLTVKENIEIGLKWRGLSKQSRQQHAADILEQLGLVTLAKRRAHELSGGETQKVAIARALVLNPDVLIMDEPFTFLDEKFIQEFEHLLYAIKEKQTQTIIFTTHDLIRAQLLSDQVWNITHGQLMLGPSINVFHGNWLKHKGIFDTGKLQIVLPDDVEYGETIMIESNQIVLSREPIASSMRNQYQGQIKALDVKGDHIRVTVEAGEKFQATITTAALKDLSLELGETIWLSFKSTAVKSV